MAYFLKQTKQNNRVFLQISETTYDKTTKKSSNRCYEKIGYLDALISEDMPDPVSFYKDQSPTEEASEIPRASILSTTTKM